MDGLNTALQNVLADAILFLPKLAAALVIFLLALTLGGVFGRWMRRALERRQADPELTILLGKITRWTVVILGTALALEQVDFDLSAFLAGLGIVGFTIGFAIQDVSKNFVAGMLLLLQQPFDLGDVIKVADFTGTVLAVDLRATELRTLDGEYVLIPNADVFTSPIINISRPDRRRISLKAGVSYESDPAEVRRVALEAISAVEGLLRDPEPALYFDNFGPATLDFTLYLWVDMALNSPLAATDQGLAALMAAFEAEGIEMPFPTQTIKIQQ